MSRGATVLRSITSTEMPSSARRSAAATASWTIRETDTTVTSVPWRTTADFPIGRRWSAGACGPFMPYSSRFSMKTTGFGSWIAARSSP